MNESRDINNERLNGYIKSDTKSNTSKMTEKKKPKKERGVGFTIPSVQACLRKAGKLKRKIRSIISPSGGVRQASNTMGFVRI
jgi:hypothetical protein